ncbi:hypothetical protein NLM33_02275 [Bradyrhizobium sp. CCGUVB1N3]|uniref:hypothetical protein n=1 Tax=Bradyrhizobium sp. CCGUVB1N3 TaxID=2949629 RepID=UPI0020B3C78C|nr:hypothetical protein [Bradyrhizobium sp. CCGUVB1N3]MCP3469149.1 hypothetical protein [Bradyrhizobium sp. CCGUVB1N3]
MDGKGACALEAAEPHCLIDRRRAAAYVGVTAGRFEQMVRDNVVPPPVMVDRSRRWPVAALDLVRQSVSTGAMEAAVAVSEIAPCGESIEPLRVLPDEAWLQQKARLVQRVRRSLLSGNEIRALREFRARRQSEISMHGYYGSFEALMVRGYVVELARKPPSSRPLVTYRLTELGEQVLAALRDE